MEDHAMTGKRVNQPLRIFAFLLTFLSTALLPAQRPGLWAETTRWQEVRSEAFAKLGEIPRPSEPVDLGAVIITMANPFWVTVRDGYEHAANELGVKMDVQAAPQENSIAAQLDVLENMIAKGYRSVVAHSITRHNLIPGLVKATQKGIPVITDSIRVDMNAAKEAGADPIDIALVDFYAQGKIGGGYLADEITKRGGGKVAIIEGLPGAPQSEARRDGAKEAFAKASSVQLVAVQPANWDRQKAYDVATNLLQAHPDLKGILCANDVMALAAVEAVETRGKKDEVMVVGVDFISQAKEAIMEGRLAASVAQAPFIIGELCTRAALKAAMGERIPQELHIPVVLVHGGNVKEFHDWK
jgi:D-allose transport system substrate-binding protein